MNEQKLKSLIKQAFDSNKWMTEEYDAVLREEDLEGFSEELIEKLIYSINPTPDLSLEGLKNFRE